MRKKLFNLLYFAHTSKATFIIFLEIILGIFLSLFSFIIFVDLAKDVLEKDGIFIENAIVNYIYSFRTPILNNIMFGITQFGAEYILAGASLVLIFLAWRDHKNEAMLFSILLSMSVMVNSLLKYLIQRPRPDFAPLAQISSYSFPSGHAMNSFVFYASLAYFVFHFTKNKKLSTIVSAISITLIILIGISRVYLGVHYPSDVIGGYLAGFWIFITVILIEKTLIFYNLFKHSKK